MQICLIEQNSLKVLPQKCSKNFSLFSIPQYFFQGKNGKRLRWIHVRLSRCNCRKLHLLNIWKLDIWRISPFTVFDSWRYCNALCDVKFRQIESNGQKITVYTDSILFISMYEYMCLARNVSLCEQSNLYDCKNICNMFRIYCTFLS